MSTGLRQFLSKTLRVFVVGKNYRVQNIQLSKIRLAGLCRQSVNVGWVWRATGAALNKPSPDVGGRAREYGKLFS